MNQFSDPQQNINLWPGILGGLYDQSGLAFWSSVLGGEDASWIGPRMWSEEDGTSGLFRYSEVSPRPGILVQFDRDGNRWIGTREDIHPMSDVGSLYWLHTGIGKQQLSSR